MLGGEALDGAGRDPAGVSLIGLQGSNVLANRLQQGIELVAQTWQVQALREGGQSARELVPGLADSRVILLDEFGKSHEIPRCIIPLLHHEAKLRFTGSGRALDLLHAMAGAQIW
jgi:hypothetical protein